MTTDSLVHRMQNLDSCVEAVEWMRDSGHPDMHSAWIAMDQPQWMAWVAVRVLHGQAMKAVAHGVRAAAKLLPPPALATLDHALLYVDGKASDEEKLLIEAFDAASAGLHVAGAAGSALVAVSYAAHTAHKLRARAALPQAPEHKKERKRLVLRASAHAADALLHVLIAAPELADTLPDLVRKHVDERALSKAWHAIPEGPKPQSRAAR